MIAEVVKSFEEHIDPKDPAINCLDTAIIMINQIGQKQL